MTPEREQAIKRAWASARGNWRIGDSFRAVLMPPPPAPSVSSAPPNGIAETIDFVCERRAGGVFRIMCEGIAVERGIGPGYPRGQG